MQMTLPLCKGIMIPKAATGNQVAGVPWAGSGVNLSREVGEYKGEPPLPPTHAETQLHLGFPVCFRGG